MHGKTRWANSMLFVRKLTSLPLSSISSATATYLTSFFSHFLSNTISDSKSLLQSHALITTSGHSTNIFVAAKLISFYSSFNDLVSSTHVFNLVSPKDTFLWNSIIKSHFSNGDYTQALTFFLQMGISNCLPNPFTLPMVVASCTELLLLELGQCIHSLAVKLGLFVGNSGVGVGSSFIYMYSKCGEIIFASKMFDEMTDRDVVAWTALIVGCVQNDENEMALSYLCSMHEIGEEMPNCRTVEAGLQACGNLLDILNGRCLHAYALKTGNAYSQFVLSSLLMMYSKCDSSEEAHLLFRDLPNKDLISWTVIIAAYARSGSISKCLELLREMQDCGIYPDGIVISCILSCFGNAGKAYEGKAFHGIIIRRKYEFDETVGNSLLSMYCKFGLLCPAEKLFDRLNYYDLESWNNMISSFGKIGLETKCIELFRKMQHLGVESDSSIIASVISSCSPLAALQLGQSIHCYVIKRGFDESISVVNSLAGLYGRLRDMATAEKLFYKAKRDIVTWNTLMSVYIHNELPSEALSLFNKMVLTDFKPNSVTLVIVLSACSQLADLDRGKRVHTYIKNLGLDCDLSVTTALIDMYIRCGQLQLSREIFDSVREKDVVLWNVMISGYGIHGGANLAMEIFQLMEASDVRPNGLSFLAVLSACNHTGLVKEGKFIFNRMRDYYVVPTLKHYACMVDLLGRSGNLQDAEAMVESMPIAPDGGIWGALLGACRIHNNVEMGERVAKRAIESDPENDGYYIVLSNLYSSMGKWEEAEKVREIMTNRGLKKTAGWSSV